MKNIKLNDDCIKISQTKLWFSEFIFLFCFKTKSKGSSTRVKLKFIPSQKPSSTCCTFEAKSILWKKIVIIIAKNYGTLRTKQQQQQQQKHNERKSFFGCFSFIIFHSFICLVKMENNSTNEKSVMENNLILVLIWQEVSVSNQTFKQFPPLTYCFYCVYRRLIFVSVVFPFFLL